MFMINIKNLGGFGDLASQREFLLRRGKEALRNKDFVLAGMCNKMLRGVITVNIQTIQRNAYRRKPIDSILTMIDNLNATSLKTPLTAAFQLDTN